jgi:hypothetical protein
MRHIDNSARIIGRRTTMALVVLPCLGLLAACDDKACPPPIPPAAASDTTAHARRVAEEKLRSSLPTPPAAVFRGMQVYQQADARVVAVCGQVNPSGRDDQAFMPFVSVVTYATRPDNRPPAFEVSHYVAASNAEATRVYIEMVSRCGENGGPRQVGNRQMVPPLPPLPSDLSDATRSGQPPGTSQSPAGQSPAGQSSPGQTLQSPAPAGTEPKASPASGRVTMRQAGNIRAAPVSGSQVVRVAPQGAALAVFAQAPGGWLQVGDGSAEGWVHSSLVETP